MRLPPTLRAVVLVALLAAIGTAASPHASAAPVDPPAAAVDPAAAPVAVPIVTDPQLSGASLPPMTVSPANLTTPTGSVQVTGPAVDAGPVAAPPPLHDVVQDMGEPVTFPDGRTMWIFADTAHVFSAPGFFHTSTVAFTDPSAPTTLRYVTDGAGAPSEFLPRSAAEAATMIPGVQYQAVWPTGATTVPDGRVIVSYSKYLVRMAPLSFTFLAAGLYEYRYPGASNLQAPVAATRLADDLWTSSDSSIGTPVYADGYVTVMTCEVWDCYALRTTPANLAVRSSYEWSTGSGWSTAKAARRPMLFGSDLPGTSPSIKYVPSLGAYILVDTTMGVVSSTGKLWMANTPQGPWSVARSFTMPGCHDDCYGVKVHPETSSPTSLRISYAINGGGPMMHVLDLPVTSTLTPVDPPPVAPPAVVSDTRYAPVTPARILDTREGPGAAVQRLGPGRSLYLKVAGRGGVPATGASAAVLNLTVTDATEPSYLSVYPHGVAPPGTSSSNFAAGKTVPNLVTTRLGRDGYVVVYNSAGWVNVIADVQGYFDNGPTAGGTNTSKYAPLTPARVLDTRDGTGAPRAPLAGGHWLDVQVAGRGGVPATGVTAVAMNLTATNTTAATYLAAWPTGATRPLVSNLNVAAGQTVPNMVIVPVGAGGRVSIYDDSGSVDVLADVVGWTGPAASGGFTPATPARILDTRTGPGPVGTVGQDRTGRNLAVDLGVAGAGIVPAGATGVVLNVTVTEATRASYLTVWPAAEARPLASNLNYGPSATTANMVVAKLDGSGRIGIYNDTGATHVIADVVGWLI